MTKYFYFVTYIFFNENPLSAGYGSDECIQDMLINDISHIRGFEKILKEKNNFETIVITNYILLKKQVSNKKSEAKRKATWYEKNKVRIAEKNKQPEHRQVERDRMLKYRDTKEFRQRNKDNQKRYRDKLKKNLTN